MNSRTLIIGVILLVLFDLFIFRSSKKNSEPAIEKSPEITCESSETFPEASLVLFQDIWPDLYQNQFYSMDLEPNFAYPLSFTNFGVSSVLPAALPLTGEFN